MTLNTTVTCMYNTAGNLIKWQIWSKTSPDDEIQNIETYREKINGCILIHFKLY